jgi:hypothetical protein
MERHIEETEQETNPSSDTPKSEAIEERDEAQEEQLDAQEKGDIGAELAGFAKEVVADHKQFPTDVVEDSKDPQRRVDEEQGVPEHEGR